ncbi:hypothetical protein KC901_03200 [Patescibacteria group bacterium]|nr:hypothetical protein [Patescibacteria group bacterium]
MRMFQIFKYIGYALKVKQGVHAPEELLADTSFSIVEGFFVTSFVVFGTLAGGSLFLGFYYGYLFFKIVGILLSFILIVDIMMFRSVKRFVRNISAEMTHRVKSTISNHQTIDVEATDVH